jgi:hypothetical protein
MIIDLRDSPLDDPSLLAVPDGTPFYIKREPFPGTFNPRPAPQGPQTPQAIETWETRYVPAYHRADGIMVFLPDYLLEEF